MNQKIHNQALQGAIDGLYQAFADRPRPGTIDACPCCLDQREIRTLITTPLREFSGEELSSYASSLFLTVGAVDDFQYFLPRIFELSAADSNWWPDPEVALGKLRLASWGSWSQVHRRAVQAFIEAALAAAVDDPRRDIDAWLCATARCVEDLTPYLGMIARNPQALIRLYEANSQQLIKGRLANSFWSDAPDARQQVIVWFGSTEVQRMVADYYWSGG